MTTNPLRPLQNPNSQDSIAKYSRPFPLEENKNPVEFDQVLPLEENLQSLLQRLHEAQAKSIQNRMNILNDLTKEKKNFEKEVEISLKQDDLAQFFTNNGELRTLNEEHLDNIEKDNFQIEEKSDIEISYSPNSKLNNSPLENYSSNHNKKKNLQMYPKNNQNIDPLNKNKEIIENYTAKDKNHEHNTDLFEEIGSEGKIFKNFLKISDLKIL